MRIRLASCLVLGWAATLAGCDDDLAIEPDASPERRPPETTLTAAPDVLTSLPTVRFEFIADPPDATFTCTLLGAAPTACVSPLELTLDDGEHTLEVAARDQHGFSDPTPARHDWRSDTTPPVTRFERAPALLDNSALVWFEFASSEDDVTFLCALDDEPLAPCGWRYQTPSLQDGPHRLAVQAVDAAGNVEVVPAVHAWTLDTSTPDTVIDEAPSGAVSSRAATIRFSSPDAGPGATFRCRLDSGLLQPCTSPWQLTQLAEGIHEVHVEVEDAAGNLDPTPATRSWTVDVTPPVVTVTGGPLGPQRLASPTFTFTSSGGIAVECRVTGAQTPDFAPCTSPFSPAALADGAHRFEVRARDAAGNQATASRGFGVDTVPPVVTIDGPSGPTRDNRPRFNFVASEFVTWRCRFDIYNFESCSSPWQPSWTLSEGAHVFSLIARDQAGHEVTINRDFRVDTFTSVWITAGPSPRTDLATPRFDFGITDAVTIECQIDSGGFAACSSPYTAPTLADGAHTFRVSVTDAAGNTNSATWSFTVDTRPLAVAFTSGPTGDTQLRRPAFTWSFGGAVSAIACRYDAAPFEHDCNAAQQVDLLDGPHTFEIRAASDSGATASATRSFTVDTVAPGVTFTDGPAATTSAATATFAFTTSGEPAVTECRLYRQGQASGAYAACASPHTVELAPPSAPYPYVFEVRVRDAAGNQWSAYRSFTYVAP